MKEGFTRYMKNHQVHWWIFIKKTTESRRFFHCYFLYGTRAAGTLLDAGSVCTV